MHRPRVEAEHHTGSLFRQPGYYWTFTCGCGYRAPFWLLLTWPAALKFANTHVWAARSWEQRIDVEVEKFRAQLDEAM